MKLFLGLAAALFASAAEAGPPASCERLYVSRQGDTVANIAERAYDGAAAMLIAGRNPYLLGSDGHLAIGTPIRLPCIAGLSDYTPDMVRLLTGDARYAAK